MPGCEQTLVAPDLPSYRGEGIREGWAFLVVPGRGRDPQAGMVADAGAQQGHDGEQSEQAGRGARDRLVRPLPLGLDAEVVTHLAESDLHLPALHKPADDLHGILGKIGAEQSREHAKSWGDQAASGSAWSSVAGRKPG